MNKNLGNRISSMSSSQPFNQSAVRSNFPILATRLNDKPLIYFDNAATTQKPQQVIDSISDFYSHSNANIHRGLHELSDRATAAYEDAREKVRSFIHAGEKAEINFVRGTTEAINLVASAWGNKFLKAGDEIIISQLEHHANIVPWYRICQEKGCSLKIIPIHESGKLDMEAFGKMLNPKTRLISVAYISNVLGLINPVKEIISMAHDAGVLVLLDAAQAAPHTLINVQTLDCDFLAFSGHKLYAPTGIGVLYGKRALLESMDPYQGGGEMIEKVTFEKITYNELPYKFEAGTPNISGAIALGAALDYVQNIGIVSIAQYESALLMYATNKLKEIEGLKIYGEAPQKAPVISFNIEGLHHFDIGSLLNQFGIAIRTGHHCTQPLMDFYGINGTCRASFAFYNNEDEIDAMINALQQIRTILMK